MEPLSEHKWSLQVSVHLHAPEVVVHPSASEMKKALARTARSLAECAKSFKRWMDGTCIESPDLPGDALTLHACSAQQSLIP